jgi:hypothetical protein
MGRIDEIEEVGRKRIAETLRDGSAADMEEAEVPRGKRGREDGGTVAASFKARVFCGVWSAS